MAELKFLRGISANLESTPKVDGQILFVTDTGNWYIDTVNDVGVVERKGSNNFEIASLLDKHLKDHAPSDAEANVIVGVSRNGTDLTVDDNRKVDIKVPELQDFIVLSETEPKNQACLWCKVLRKETKS